MKLAPIVGLAAGLVAVSLLLIWQGLAEVAGILAKAGPGLLLLTLIEPPNQLLWATAWHRLFLRQGRPPFARTFSASWMGAAVNTLLPVASVGGDLIKARVLALWGHSAVAALSTVVVDKTVQALSVLVVGVIGVVLLAAMVPDRRIVLGAAAGALALALGIGGFIALQLAGSFTRLARLVDRVMGSGRGGRLVVGAEQLDAAVRSIYRRPLAIASACSVLLAAQLMLVSEVLLAAYLMGSPIGVGEALLLKALTTAIRGFSFAIPSGLGVQEGGYILVGGLVGLPPDLMLALSLATRVREVVPSVPLLLAWQRVEARALMRRRIAAGD